MAKNGDMPIDLMEGVIVGEFGDGEYLRPVRLLIIAKTAHKVFNGLIGAFRLTIRLGVECGREIGSGTEESCYLAPPG